MGERVVLLKIAVMFLVLLTGWAARRRGYLAGETMSALSRFTVDVGFPALVFVQMLRTVGGQNLAEGWYLPLACAAVLALGWPVGLLLAPSFAGPEQRRTFWFVSAFANYVYLPLPIAEALYGEAGVRAILLCNVGGQVLLWSLGVWMLRGGLTARESARQVLLNPGMIATFAGLAVGWLIPAARGLEELDPASAPLWALPAAAAVQAMALLGTLVIPLSLLVIGAQLGGLALRVHRPSRAVVGAVLARLVATPAVALAIWAALSATGLQVPEVARVCTLLIATMPTGFTCSLFAERFGGDVELSAQAILYSTLASLVTVPLMFMAGRALGV